LPASSTIRFLSLKKGLPVVVIIAPIQIAWVELNLRAIGCLQSRLSTDFFWRSFCRLNVAKQFFVHGRTLLA